MKTKHLTKLYSDDTFNVQTLEQIVDLEKRPTIIIIPPTGGTNLLDKQYSNYFYKHEFNSIVLDHWSLDDEYNLDLEIHDRFYKRAFKAIELVINKLKLTEVYLLGTSVGAIHATIATHKLSVVKKTFIIAGGAPISSIVVESDQKVLSNAKSKRYEMYNFKDDLEYDQMLNSSIELEPFNFSHSLDGKKLGMIIGNKDKTVPTKYQLQLKNHWKPSVEITIANDHFTSIVKSYLFHRKKILNFFAS